MKFQSKYDKKPFKGEKMDPISQVDTAGYVSSEKRINGMMQCGQQIRAIAPESYDFKFEPDDFQPDPTRSKGFDMTDARLAFRAVAGNGQKPSQTVQEAPQETSKGENAPE